MSSSKCSFCLSAEEGRKYLTSDDGSACVCSNCAMMLAQYVLQENIKKVEDNKVADEIDATDDNDKNLKFQDYLVALEDKWMEKNIINSYVLDAGGRVNQVTFRFEDEDDDFYFVCELEVEDIDKLPDSLEKKILDEIEWAFDEIRPDCISEGLDMDGYLGDKLLLSRVN